MKAQRYSPIGDRVFTGMVPNENGKYVKFSDYATLEAKAERLREELQILLSISKCRCSLTPNAKLCTICRQRAYLSTLENETTEEVKGETV